MDVALVSDEWVGAHAVWDAERLIEALVAGGDPTVPGLAGVAGMVAPADGAAPGVHLRFGRPGRPAGSARPGRLTPLWLREMRRVGVDRAVTMRGPGTLALDGERELVLRAGEEARVHLAADGPRVLDVAGVLRAHARGRTNRRDRTPTNDDRRSVMPDDAVLREMHHQMVRIRLFEETLIGVYIEGKTPAFDIAAGPVPGEMHLAAGQEPVAAGVCAHLRRPTRSPRPTGPTTSRSRTGWT